jgi:hypothetical protein
MGKRNLSSDTQRLRIEAAIGRYQQVIGDGLRLRKDARRTTEVGVTVHGVTQHVGVGTPDLRSNVASRTGPRTLGPPPHPHNTVPSIATLLLMLAAMARLLRLPRRTNRPVRGSMTFPASMSSVARPCRRSQIRTPWSGLAEGTAHWQVIVW